MSHKENLIDICLIIPPSTFLLEERVFPSLGVLAVASSLEREGANVDVLDLSGVPNYREAIDRYTQMGRTTTFGITATTPQIPAAVEVVDEIRHKAPQGKIILGGPHATLTHTAHKIDTALSEVRRGTHAFRQLEGYFDSIVAGDGEKAIFEALKVDSPSVIDAGLVKSPLFLKRGELDQFPIPNRKLIDINSYEYKIDSVQAQSILIQRGCPFGCGYCGGRESHVFRLIRNRSVDSALEEFRDVYHLTGRRGFMLYDDELNIKDESFREFLEGLIKLQKDEGIEMRFRGFVKAELFTLEQAKLMYQAGFRMVLSGTESGSNQMLTAMEKGTTSEINSQWLSYCHEAGLSGKALMSIGHPGETPETLAQTREWLLNNLRPDLKDEFDVTIITEYPGSPYFDRSVLENAESGIWTYTAPRTGGVLFSKEVDYIKNAEYYKGVPGDYTSYVWTESLTPGQLVQARDSIEDDVRKYLGLSPLTETQPKIFPYAPGTPLPDYILKSTTTI